MEKYFMEWSEVFDRISKAPNPEKVFGIPRGGAIVAGLLATRFGSVIVNNPAEADLIVDDIIDSGRTMKRIAGDKNQWALVNKLGEDKNLGWIVFPWEERDETADAEDTVIRQLEFIGENPKREGLIETPKRVLKALKEMTQGYQINIESLLKVTFSEPCDEMIVVKGIEFWSLCEHHLLPFHGRATIAYIPRDGKVVGLSKIPRLLNAYSQRLQVQERLTRQIADALQEYLNPIGIGVIIEAEHLCMRTRGVKGTGAMVTSDLRGMLKDDAKARAEFLAFRNA